MSLENLPVMGKNIHNIISLPKYNNLKDIIGTFMGRDALSLAVKCLDLGVGDKVLLPAYLCGVVLKPFLGKTKIEFYDLKPDLTIDPEDIEPKLIQGQVKLVLIINYFGFIQPYRNEIKKICSDRGILIIEDCAHSLLTEGSGDTGDISIYSFAKILPLWDGGGLKINIEGNTINPDYYPRAYSNILSVLIMLKSILNVRADMLSRAWLSSRKKAVVSDSTSIKKDSRILPMSYFAYNGIKKNKSIQEIIKKRRNDFQIWHSLAERTDIFEPVFSELPLGVCPLGYPIKIKDRDLLKLRLQKKGIYLKSHWHLPDVVGKEFYNSHNLSRQTITLPVYHELKQQEQEVIQRVLTS